jgi:hypothetical protein
MASSKANAKEDVGENALEFKFVALFDLPWDPLPNFEPPTI